jgi:hypothetical protein
MSTATEVCRRASSIKVRISINNLPGSWLFRSRSRCLILTLLLCSPDHDYPWILDHCSRWVSREEIDRSAGPKLTAERVPHRGRDPFIWKKDATHGILEKLKYGLPQTPPRIRVVRTAGTIREQHGEETIPNDPKRS